MAGTEFYLTPNGGVMIHDLNGTRLLRESDRTFIQLMIEKLSDFYPEVLKVLSNEFENSRKNVPYFEFRIVQRFIKCNWGKFDSVMDIDEFGSLNFEEVECPIRGECKMEGVVCKPKFNSNLSDREIEVMKYFWENKTPEEIADILYISVKTVSTHRRNAFKRTNSHTLAQFFTFAKSRNIFEN